MFNPFYFTHKVSEAGLNNILDSHHKNHINSELTTTPKYLEIEKVHVNNPLKEMANIYARLLNQYKVKCQTVFSARFDEEDKDD